jgi:exonuclease SbcD
MFIVGLRLLHTSDWHLGRSLHEESLLADQAWALDRIEQLVDDARPDVLVVAGDVYDRAVPPPEAVSLLDDFLIRISRRRVPVVIIAGNHDSPERLAFGARLLEGGGVHLRGGLARCAAPVEVAGKGLVYAVPFIEPERVRDVAQDETLRGHAAATAHVLEQVRADRASRALPAVLVAHAFVQGGVPTPESERPCAVGGAGVVPAASFDGFDYVALGHLHAPQEVAPSIRYSGSLLKYSFSEADQPKGVVLAEVDRGTSRCETIGIGARRDVVRIRGKLEDLLHRSDLARHEGDLVEATLEDDGYVVDAKNRLQARFRHVLNVNRIVLTPTGEGEFARRVARAGGDDAVLFDSFFERVTGALPAPEIRGVFSEALEQLQRRDRAA